MKKLFIIILLCVIIPVYVWDVYLLVAGWYGQNRPTSQSAASRLPEAGDGFQLGRPVIFVEQGKSPFTAYRQKPKPIAVKTVFAETRPRQSVPKTDVAAPKVIITGIMWNPQTPLVMLSLPGGTSTVAKAGQTLAGGITVKTIEKNRIRIVYENAQFWISK
jgi:hypothetical protein